MANQVLYGFETLQTLADRRVTDVGVQVVNDAIVQAVAEHNRQIDALMGLFVEQTTEFKRKYRQMGVRRLQPLDEQGRALPTMSGASYDVAWPIQRAGDAIGYTHEAAIKATVGELQARLAELLAADARWMRDHMLAALLDKNSWTFVDDEHGSLTILPLANGDSVTYQISGGDAATDNHYIAQAAGIADATNPFPTIRTELTEHPENGGEVVAIIPTGLVATTKALAGFHAASDPNLRVGMGETELVGSLGVALPGDIIGYVDGVWVVEWRNMVASYIVAATTEGPRALRMRQHPEPELQGFSRQADRNDYPWYEQQWARRAGFGAYNRVGAVAYFVAAGDTTYDVPAGYSNPMP